MPKQRPHAIAFLAFLCYKYIRSLVKTNMSESITAPAEIVKTPLQGSLEQQRQSEALTAARTAAVASIKGAEVEASAFLVPDSPSHPDTKSLMSTIGTESSPHVRRAVSVIEQAAEQANIPATGDRTTAQEKFVADEPVVQWGKWHDAREIRFNDPGGALRAKAAEIEAAQNAPLQELTAALEAGQTSAVTSRQFSLAEKETQDTVFDFMNKEPRGQTEISRGVRFMNGYINGVNRLPVRLAEEGWPTATESGNGVYLGPDGTVAKIVKEIPDRPGVYHGMYFEAGATDLTSASFRLGVEIDEARAGLEFGFEGSVAEPFIQSKTATEFINTTTQQGLQPTEHLQALLAGSKDAVDRRYGNSYSELGREIAKYVNDPTRSAARLFEGDETTVRQTLAEMDTQNLTSDPAKVVLGLLSQTMGRLPEAAADSSIPVYEGRVHMKDMSCKDVENAYAEGTDLRTLTLQPVGNTVMAVRQKGEARSAINLEPVRYKGVDLPAGSLFQVHDGEFMFVRPTAMQFDKAAGKDAYGWQYHEGGNYEGSSNEILMRLRNRYQTYLAHQALQTHPNQEY